MLYERFAKPLSERLALPARFAVVLDGAEKPVGIFEGKTPS